MPQSSTLDVGLDVHQESIAVAYIAHAHAAEGVSLGPIGARPWDIDTLIRPLPSTSTYLVFVYEAGPGGSWLSRDLSTHGSGCWVMAPAVIPNKAGDRVKPARREALQRARLMRSGARTPAMSPRWTRRPSVT